MARRDKKPWQFKVSFALAIAMLFLVFGYFTQSFLEIRKVQPVRVAIERVTGASNQGEIRPEAAPSTEQEDQELPE